MTEIIKYIKKTVPLCLTNNQTYDVLSIEKGWYRIIDDSGEDYLYPPENFEIKVKYIGKHETPALDRKKIYNVIAVEKGWFRIMTEIEDDYLFPPNQFEIIEQ